MNKSELIDAVAEATGQPKSVAHAVVNGLLDTIEQEVKRGERVSLPGFGTFERRSRSARTARNPRTGEEIHVPATKVPGFRPGGPFKELLTAQQPPKKTPGRPKPT